MSRDLLGSSLLYVGVVALLLGGFALLRPLRWLGLETRGRAAALAVGGALAIAAAVLLPNPQRQAQRSAGGSRLDEFVPVFEFAERHATSVRASCAAVFAATRAVTAEEIRLFRLLTWLRHPRLPGQRAPESILAPPAAKPIVEVALDGGFVLLAEEPPRELLVGTVVVRPPGPPRGELTPETFRELAAPGYAKAGMTFLLAEEPGGGCRLATETRVHATDGAARRRFAVYWRVIYPGSALIRRQWLAAIRRRAEAAPELP